MRFFPALVSLPYGRSLHTRFFLLLHFVRFFFAKFILTLCFLALPRSELRQLCGGARRNRPSGWRSSLGDLLFDTIVAVPGKATRGDRHDYDEVWFVDHHLGSKVRAGVPANAGMAVPQSRSAGPRARQRGFPFDSLLRGLPPPVSMPTRSSSFRDPAWRRRIRRCHLIIQSNHTTLPSWREGRCLVAVESVVGRLVRCRGMFDTTAFGLVHFGAAPSWLTVQALPRVDWRAPDQTGRGSICSPRSAPRSYCGKPLPQDVAGSSALVSAHEAASHQLQSELIHMLTPPTSSKEALNDRSQSPL